MEDTRPTGRDLATFAGGSDRLMAYENGDMSFDEQIELLQELVDSGLAWKLQGFYGRAAQYAIDQGWITGPIIGPIGVGYGKTLPNPTPLQGPITKRGE